MRMRSLAGGNSRGQDECAGQWQRKKTINLGTSDFEDFLTPKMLSNLDIIDNDNLLTLMVSMSKDIENGFWPTTAAILAGQGYRFYGLPEEQMH